MLFVNHLSGNKKFHFLLLHGALWFILKLLNSIAWILDSRRPTDVMCDCVLFWQLWFLVQQLSVWLVGILF